MVTLPRRLPLLLHLSRWSRNRPLSYCTFSAAAIAGAAPPTFVQGGTGQGRLGATGVLSLEKVGVNGR